MVVMISGKQSSGKSTLVANLQSHFEKFTSIKYATPLYEMSDLLYGYLEKYDIPYQVKDGELLQLLGTHFRKKFGDSLWSDVVLKRISDLWQDQDMFICIDDCRFKVEFNSLNKILRIRLECPEELRKERSPHWRETTQHISETDLDSYAAEGRFDFYIDTSCRNDDETLKMALGAIAEYKKLGLVDSSGDYESIFKNCR